MMSGFQSLNGYQWKTHKNSESMSTPTIGFEWEYAVVKPYLWLRTLENKEKVKDLKFTCHQDSGGIEFVSPVSRTLHQSKAVYKTLKKFIEREKLNSPKNRLSQPWATGVHVCLSYPKPKKRYNLAKHAIASALIANKGKTKDFLFEISGREAEGVWGIQAVASEWDKRAAEGYRFKPVYLYDFPLLSKGSDILRVNHSGIKIQNGRGPKGGLEFRFFGDQEDIVPVALDFCHALFVYSNSVSNIMKLKLNNDRFTLPSEEYLVDKTPSLEDMKAWVQKKDGYVNLKRNESWKNL